MADHGPVPIRYAADVKSDPALDEQASGALIVEYLKNHKKRGADSSYPQLLYEYEQLIRAELAELFSGDQGDALTQLGIGSLILDMDTGYSPVDDEINRLIALRAEQPGAASDAQEGDRVRRRRADIPDWTLSSTGLQLHVSGVTAEHGVDCRRLYESLSLDRQQAMLLKYLLDRLRDDCAELWAALADDYKLSPMEFIVDLTFREPDHGYEATEQQLIDYLGTTRKLDSASTYLALQEGLERALYRDVAGLLDADQIRTLQSIGSLLNIDTGHTPIAGRVSQLRAETTLKRGINVFCGMPFEYAHIEDTGDVLPCCPSKFTLSIGNLKQDTMHDVWNSRAAEAVRESIHDKTFRFCNYYACEYLKEGRRNDARD